MLNLRSYFPRIYVILNAYPLHYVSKGEHHEHLFRCDPIRTDN